MTVIDGTALVTDVTSCSRCGLTHNGVRFTPVTPPIDGVLNYDFWAPCPTTGQPLLMSA